MNKQTVRDAIVSAAVAVIISGVIGSYPLWKSEISGPPPLTGKDAANAEIIKNSMRSNGYEKMCAPYRQWQKIWAKAWTEKLVKQKGVLSEDDSKLLGEGNRVDGFEKNCPPA